MAQRKSLATGTILGAGVVYLLCCMRKKECPALPKQKDCIHPAEYEKKCLPLFAQEKGPQEKNGLVSITNGHVYPKPMQNKKGGAWGFRRDPQSTKPYRARARMQRVRDGSDCAPCSPYSILRYGQFPCEPKCQASPINPQTPGMGPPPGYWGWSIPY